MPRAGPPRRVRIIRHFKILDRLDPAHREALDAQLLARGGERRLSQNAKFAQRWLAALGCEVNLATVCRYRDWLHEEKQRRRDEACELEDAAHEALFIARLARDRPLPDLAAPTKVLVDMLLLETVFNLRDLQDVTPAELSDCAGALGALAAAGRDVGENGRGEAPDSARQDRPQRPSTDAPPDGPPLGRRGKAMRIESLPDDVRARYERDVLADPKTTALSAQRWLADHGHRVSRAAVTRHRARLAQEAPRRARAAALDRTTRELAAREGLTDADLARGAALSLRLKRFDRLRAAFHAAHHGRLASPAELNAIAMALRTPVGDDR